MQRVLSFTTILLILFGISQCSFEKSVAESPKESDKFVVAIDVGHGGFDPGATSKSNIQEKDIVLELGKKLATELNKQDVTVVYTRKSDKFVSLQDRLKIARENSADVLLSLHNNTSRDPNKSGFCTFYQEHSEFSQTINQLLHEELQKANLFRDQGSKSSRHYLIRESTIPCVILDIAYLSNPADVRKITNSTNQDKIVNTLTAAINRYQNLLTAAEK